MKRIQIPEEGRAPAKGAQNWRIEGERKRITRKECGVAVKQFRNGRINGAKRLVELGKSKRLVAPCCSGWEFVEPQFFSFTKKRAHCGSGAQEEMRYEGSPVEAPQFSRRRMAPPTPMQNSYTSFVRDKGRYEEEGRGWNARERTIIARTKEYLERSFSVKVQIEASEALLGPVDVDVDLRRILKEARRTNKGAGSSKLSARTT